MSAHLSHAERFVLLLCFRPSLWRAQTVPLFCSSAAFAAALLGLTLLLHYALATPMDLYARILGGAAALLTIVQWTPQIIETVRFFFFRIVLTPRAKSEGALSLWMLLLQAPGSLLIIVLQAISPGVDWTTVAPRTSDASQWLPYLLGLLQQLILIALVLVFRWRERRCQGDRDPLLIN